VTQAVVLVLDKGTGSVHSAPVQLSTSARTFPALRPYSAMVLPVPRIMQA